MDTTTLTLEIPALVIRKDDAPSIPETAEPSYFKATTDQPVRGLLHVAVVIAIAAHLAAAALLANLTVPLPVASAPAASAQQAAVVEVSIESVETVPADR